MTNINADIGRMRDFVADLKRHKEAINLKNRDIINKLRNLNSYWKDKAYESFKESPGEDQNEHRYVQSVWH